MNALKRILLVLGSVFLIFLVVYAGYIVFLYSFYNVAGGAVDAKKLLP